MSAALHPMHTGWLFQLPYRLSHCAHVTEPNGTQRAFTINRFEPPRVVVSVWHEVHLHLVSSTLLGPMVVCNAFDIAEAYVHPHDIDMHLKQQMNHVQAWVFMQ